MKNFKLIILLIFISNVFSQEISNKYAETITSEELKSLIYVYASDSFEGREAGTRGEILAVEFIRAFYLINDIKPANGTDNYFQKTNKINLVLLSDEKDIEKIKIYDLTETHLVLVNTKNKNRADILEIVNIFRSKVVDLSENFLIIEVTGDPGKMAAMEQLLYKFGIVEIARTGKISLIRESQVDTNYLKIVKQPV